MLCTAAPSRKVGILAFEDITTWKPYDVRKLFPQQTLGLLISGRNFAIYIYHYYRLGELIEELTNGELQLRHEFGCTLSTNPM